MPSRPGSHELSTAAQQYLLALRVMTGTAEGGRVTAAQVARGLGVTTQAASEMFRRLLADGLVAHADGGRDLHLTTAGRTAADAIFRRHALLEWLLTTVIGLGWAESDDEAMRLQGAISPRVEARLDEMLGHPETCPHGNPIDAETAKRRPTGTPLSKMSAGDRATDLPDHGGGRGGRRPALVPRGPRPDAGRPRHDPRPLRIARLADARRPARPRDAGPPTRRRSSASCPARPIPACSTRSQPRRHAERVMAPTAPVRVRIAPSPTGPLHIGTARTALFNYLFARHVGGTFVLRLEDTDQARGTLAFETDILEGLHWLGLALGRGPRGRRRGARGPYGPYRQMQRLPLYAAAAERLLAEDLRLPVLLHARGAGGRPRRPGGRAAAAELRRPLRDADAGGAGRPRGRGPARRPPLPRRGGGRRLRRHRPRPRRDRHREPRRRLRHRPRRRHARSTTSPWSSTTPRWRSPTSSAARTTSPTRRSTSCCSGRSGTRCRASPTCR